MPSHPGYTDSFIGDKKTKTFKLLILPLEIKIFKPLVGMTDCQTVRGPYILFLIT